MILKPTFTNGKLPSVGPHIVSSLIPPTELNRIRRTKSSAEIIVALLNEMEVSYSRRQKIALIWNECPHCQTIFIAYRKQDRKYCSRQCNGHYRGQEWKKWGKVGSEISNRPENRKRKGNVGAKNPAWKGGLTYFKRKGKYANQSIKYVRCPKRFASMSRKDGYVMEHRLLVAMEMGRPLLRTECVHHINHDATDNRIENLMLFKSNADHKRFEHGQAIEPLWQLSRPSNTAV